MLKEEGLAVEGGGKNWRHGSGKLKNWIKHQSMEIIYEIQTQNYAWKHAKHLGKKMLPASSFSTKAYPSRISI